MIRRATLAARVAAALAAGIVAAVIFTMVAPGPRSLIVWLVLIGAVYYFVFKLAQRVSFEAIRARGVPPPED